MKAEKKKILRFFKIVTLIVLANITMASCVSNYFYSKTIARNSKDFLYKSKDIVTVPPKKGTATPVRRWIEDQNYETVSIISQDGLKLVGYYLPADKTTTDSVILAHGYSCDAFMMSAFAEFYHKKLGFNVLMPDARGHGASGGNYIGFGWPERLDYLQWINWLTEKSKEAGASRIVLHGVSMGAATVLMTSGENMPQTVKAVIEDCGYTSVDEELSWQLKRLYHLGRNPIIPNTSKLTKKKAGYSFEEASALEQVKKSITPTLFIHGDADTFVPFKMMSTLYDACPSYKEIFVIPGAGHAMAFWTDRTGYETRVRAFLEKQMGKLL